MDYGCRIMFEYFGCKIAVGRVRLLLYEVKSKFKEIFNYYSIALFA